MMLMEAALDWPGEDEGDMGCGAVSAAQFIESCERFKDIRFVSASVRIIHTLTDLP
jgi:hypothetical protein